jgi:Putative transposase/Transposase zinc-binding domain
MTTLRAIFTAFAPQYLERSPHLPTAHRQVISAIPHCRRGSDGPSRSPCPHWERPHRVPPSCGHRHCPPCQQHTTPQWLQHHRDTQLPGPHCLLTLTVPETLRPFSRSPPRLASHALLQASATALKRLAQDERFVGPDLPGFTGVLPTWGRPLPDHPHRHDMGPGGGLSKDRTGWWPSRAHFFVPVKALAPISRALFQAALQPAGLLEPIAPQVGTLPWNVPSQAQPHGSSACTSLAPSVCNVAIAHRRLVGLMDRPVTCTARKGGRARRRTTPLDVMALLRRFLQHVLPEGCVKVRHCGVLHARCAVPLATIRLMMGQGPPREDQPPRRTPPRVGHCPTCGVPRHVVMRVWTSPKAVAETS